MTKAIWIQHLTLDRPIASHARHHDSCWRFLDVAAALHVIKLHRLVLIGAMGRATQWQRSAQGKPPAPDGAVNPVPPCPTYEERTGVGFKRSNRTGRLGPGEVRAALRRRHSLTVARRARRGSRMSASAIRQLRPDAAGSRRVSPANAMFLHAGVHVGSRRARLDRIQLEPRERSPSEDRGR